MGSAGSGAKKPIFFYKLKVLSTRSLVTIRAVGGSENPGVPVLFGRHNLPPLVEIGLTDLPKSGGSKVPRHPQGRQAWAYKGPEVCTNGY